MKQEAPEGRDCSRRHEGCQLDERNDALLLLNKGTTLQSHIRTQRSFKTKQ